MNFINSREFTKQLDAQDELAAYKTNLFFHNITGKMLFISQEIFRLAT